MQLARSLLHSGLSFFNVFLVTKVLDLMECTPEHMKTYSKVRYDGEIRQNNDRNNACAQGHGVQTAIQWHFTTSQHVLWMVGIGKCLPLWLSDLEFKPPVLHAHASWWTWLNLTGLPEWHLEPRWQEAVCPRMPASATQQLGPREVKRNEVEAVDKL